MLAAYHAHLLGAMGNLFSTARHADNLLAMDRVFHLIHVWALISDSVGFMGAQRLMRSCVAANKGAREYLQKLPHLVVYGGYALVERVVFDSDGRFLVNMEYDDGILPTPRSRKVWGLDPLTLRWNERAELLVGRSHHACCEVRGRVVILSGCVEEWRCGDPGPATVEMCGDDDVFHRFPSLSAGHLCGEGTVAVEIVETDSESGQVLLIGGSLLTPRIVGLRTVYAVDIATGQCTPQPSMIHARTHCAAARLPDGSVICAGGELGECSSSAEILYPGASAWALLPNMRVPRSRFSACVMSDGRFAVFGGCGSLDVATSCEVLSLRNGAPQWKPLPAMNYPREAHACVAFAGCVFVVGGASNDYNSASVYDEAKRKWFELPHALPRQLGHMGGVIIPRHPPIRRVT